MTIPVLQAEGLASDRLGDVMRYFEISDGPGALRALLMPQRAHDGSRPLARGDCATARAASPGYPAVGAWALGGLAVSLPGLVYLLS